jgi:superfamily II DNA or RNA helicase
MKTCIITVADEVNCKLKGLEVSDARRLMKMFEHEVPYARHLPAVKLGRWNGKIAFFQLGGSTYINLLPEIVPKLDEWGYNVELVDTRTYSNQVTFNAISADTFKHKTWPKGHPKAGEPVELRDYQIEIVNTFLNNPQCLQEIATGAGKTLITATLSYSCENLGRTIVIVPNKSLVTQTEADYINLGLDVGVYFGDRKDIGKTHTICTWQSLNNLLKNTKSGNLDEGDLTIGEFLEDVVCVMVDEVHMAKADALKTMLTGVMSHIPIRWGLTGTIPKEKFESEALRVSLGEVVGKLAARDLQDQGVLAQCNVNILQLDDQVDFANYQSELKFLLDNKERLDTIAQRISEIALSGNTLVLVDRINAGQELVARLGERAAFVSGGTKDEDRKEHYGEVADVDDKILVATYGVAAVGINVPRLFNVVLIEPGKSFVRVIQSIGRGLRKAEDKDYVQIWDVTSTCKFAKRHLTKRKQFYKEAQYPFQLEKIYYR